MVLLAPEIDSFRVVLRPVQEAVDQAYQHLGEDCYDAAEHLILFIAETNAIQDGATALRAAELTGEHFGEAASFVVETETSEAFDDLLAYQEIYMVPQAGLASRANDMSNYNESSFEFFLETGVAQAAGAGAVASGVVSAYTLKRCGSLRWP